MKKFFLKGILFCAVIVIICTVVLLISTKEPMRSILAQWTGSTEYMDESGMLPVFADARQQDETTQMIIGDSICRQMCSNLETYNPQTSFLATNAALMVTGQYLLAEEYLKNHQETTDIFLVMHPLSLARDFDTEWNYRYAVMPYVETDTLQYLDQNTIDMMEDMYGEFFMRREIVQLVEDSPICRKLCLNYINENGSGYIQSSSFEIADQYVKKLYELCEESNVELHLYASPVTEYHREQIEKLTIEYQETWMSSIYPDYMKDILFYPSEWTEDFSHFSGKYAERENLNEMMERAYGQTAFLKKIKIR